MSRDYDNDSCDKCALCGFKEAEHTLGTRSPITHKNGYRFPLKECPGFEKKKERVQDIDSPFRAKAPQGNEWIEFEHSSMENLERMIFSNGGTIRTD